MSLEPTEIVLSLGVWRKGSSAVTVELVTDRVRITPVVGNPFFIPLDDWSARKARIEEEGWIREEELVDESDFMDTEVRMSVRTTLRVDKGYEVNIPGPPSLPTNLGELPWESGVEVPEEVVSKVLIPSGAVLRRKDGELYLLPCQEGGWENFAFPVESEDEAAEKFNVRLGAWDTDEHGEFCPVTKSPIKVVLKPPRPGDRKTG